MLKKMFLTTFSMVLLISIFPLKYVQADTLETTQLTNEKRITSKDEVLSYAKKNNLPLEYDGKEIAEIIKDEFPDTNFTDLVAMVDNYKSYDSWLKTPKISEEIMINLENIMIDNNELEETINFNELVYEFN